MVEGDLSLVAGHVIFDLSILQKHVTMKALLMKITKGSHVTYTSLPLEYYYNVNTQYS